MTSPSIPPDLSKLRINRDAPSPPLRRALKRNLALLLGAVILFGGAFLILGRGRAVAVQTAVATAMSGAGESGSGGAGTSVTANGYVVARTRASVAAKLPGRIRELRVSEGSYMKKGDIIATLDNADYQAQLGQAEAALTSAQADLTEARAARDVAEREAQRLRKMRSKPGLVTDEEYDASVSRADQAIARAQATEARINSADAARRFALANLENTVIRAPFTGTVLRKEAEVGEVVAPSVGGGLTRGAVVTMADLTTLEVEVDVNEAYIARVRKAQPARIILDAYPDTSFKGQVRQVVPTADRQRATVQVKVSILDRDPRILPEMGARVDFLDTTRVTAGAAAPSRFRMPAAAVRELNGQSVVWLVRNGRLESRAVEAGPVSGGFREIRSGLAGGEVLLVGGVDEPKAGMRVKAAQ